MKVIDLLNKIANGEEVPVKFGFMGNTFEKQGNYIEDEDGDSIFDSIYRDFSNINDEIEIIEDKGIENNFQHVYNSDNDLIDANFENIKTTLGNIIKVINEMRKDK